MLYGMKLSKQRQKRGGKIVSTEPQKETETCSVKTDTTVSSKEKKTRGGKIDTTRDEVSYVTDVPVMTKAVASRLKKNPTELKRGYLMKVILNMEAKKNETAKKNQHKLIQRNRGSGEIALQRCACPSLEKIANNSSPTDMFRSTVHTIYRAIRLAILNHDWSYCLTLYVRLLNMRSISKRNGLYILRVIVIAALNSNIRGDELEKFLRITFGLVNYETRAKFLKSLFTIPEELKGPRKKCEPRKKDEEEDESAFEPEKTTNNECTLQSVYLEDSFY